MDTSDLEARARKSVGDFNSHPVLADRGDDPMTAPTPPLGLVVVDMQNAFCAPGGAIYVPQAEAQLPAVASAIALCRSAGIPVIYTTVVWEQPDDVPRGIRQNHPGLVPEWDQPGGLTVNSWGAALHEAVAPLPGDHILRKRGFHPPGLAELAHRLGLRSVLLAGTTANNCVYAAALALFEADLDVLAVADCISGFAEDLRLPWLQNIDRFLGRVVTLGDVRDWRPTGRPVAAANR
jgi:nicotinamidase-related amidase